MPVNFNPPPLPNPDAARAAQATIASADDEGAPADLFAQLIAAATIAKAPVTAEAGEEADAGDDARKADAARADAAPSDWMLALGATPLAVLQPAPVERLRAPLPGADAAATDRTPLRALAARDERTTRSGIDVDAARPASSGAGTQVKEPLLAAADATLREQLTAALESRAGTQPTAAPAITEKTARARDALPFGPSDHPSSAASAPALAAAITAAVEREHGPERGPHASASTLEAPAPVAAAVHAPATVRFEAPALVTIDAPVGTAGFGDEVASKLAHVVLRHDRAEVRLSPAELGPVDIRIDLRSDGATLTIVAAHAATRDALEQALPQLRESLAAQGIALGQAAIHDGRSQPDRRFGEPAPAPSRLGSLDVAASPVLATAQVPLSNRLVDTFA